MSNVDNDTQGYSLGQVLLAAVAGIVGIALFVFLVGKIFGVSDQLDVVAPMAAETKVIENIKPVAVVELASAESAGAKVEKSGEEVVKGVCAMCHEAGLMNSPKLGDKAQWAPRIAQGYETLVKHAIEGIRTMPARGGNPALTDGEIANAVVHMANGAGAKFAAPKSAEPAPVAEETKPAEVVAAVVAEQAMPAAGKGGEEVYKLSCAMCHTAGLMNAPKLGDKAQWEPRIKQGYATLVTNATKGIRMMPAKGGNPALTDAEVADTVKYMANAAGAGF
ncbi:MAG: c-type cytochrome [Methylotenera sp.]|nr:c-type cytochrome [Methylotenera sp.]MDP1960502.1 c-type cytochrome [Methylotenera sp.]MDP3207419.1 c-type cytochrome [Methylotenera sp.]MDP3303868.1 c-type cytochrome [Methylotenera sp.]MDP3943789.1 c-type cytochrome [Methylotenera sp.]